MPRRHEGCSLRSSGFEASLFQAVPVSIGTEHAPEKKRKYPKSAIKTEIIKLL